MSSSTEVRDAKLEEVLEVKSFRRIVSAYLNYRDAAEEDVRRYEKYFRKLSPDHKALVCHLPLKFQKLRRCISVNSFFILNMLQAFDPPLDMTLDIDVCEGDFESSSHDFHASHTHDEYGNVRFGLPVNTGETLHSEHYSSKLSNTTYRSRERSSNKDLTNCGNCVLPEESGGCERLVNDTLVDAVPRSNIKIENSSANSQPNWWDPSLQLKVPLVDVDKVRCVIRNIVRDWTSEGQIEREQCYKPILEALDHLFPVRSQAKRPCCLVPGAGLGRLALEISCSGFVCQGNEFSYYMMICSSFILNHTCSVGEWIIYPWIHSNSNSLSDCDQLRPVTLPDILPASAGITEGFSMCGGDFMEVYNDLSQERAWDAVVTCFFLDTAHNIVEYIEVISKILKDGGVWINLGPLLYHFADTYSQDEMSIELSLEDVKKVAIHFGFVFEVEKTIETTYTANPRSMMQNRYYAAFWTMRKRNAIKVPSSSNM